MRTQLARKKYDSKINIYYQDVLPYELAEEIIQSLWINTSQQINENYKLIQETKAKVYKLTFDNQVYYLKSYSPRSTSKILKNLFRPIEAIRCFQTDLKLNKANIPAAKPVLAITRKVNCFLVDSIFVTREVPGIDLFTYMTTSNLNNPELRKKIMKKLAIIWSDLINNNFLHIDPGLNNLIIKPEKKDIQLKLIDIDAIYSLPFIPKKLLIIKNLLRLKQRMNFFAATKAESNLFITHFLKRCILLKNST
ncbi:lipopolysaccharide kinase InaA family protein [Anaerospora hongkongensis]|uniref:lipopolysaccharide kinase InaA family protein n=1 Tax=Anaerospora hongkongensis TaxID=244830 RepID=UPI002FDAB7B3